MFAKNVMKNVIFVQIYKLVKGVFIQMLDFIVLVRRSAPPKRIASIMCARSVIKVVELVTGNWLTIACLAKFKRFCGKNIVWIHVH